MNQIDHVLLVDDDVPTNFIHEVILKKTNRFKQIGSVLSATEALDYLQVSRPNLIFLDINMPALSGWDFIDQFRSLPLEQKENIVIVMLSTSMDPKDRKRAEICSEIQEFVSKPISVEKVEDILVSHF
ncbi:MAG: response regulator [Reichenbachiella sp.]|uniref:response regulator n=1 Tax=Reichenbachiella sp. TaxID=2184521 RepID=UPI002966913A|nr:response regulator [Reichenbachiella sp.]MDW3210681.1 response regulator [Reichenbachiella sp.]